MLHYKSRLMRKGKKTSERRTLKEHGIFCEMLDLLLRDVGVQELCPLLTGLLPWRLGMYM